MGIFKLYSMRQKEARGEYPDVYVYDEIPEKLKKQALLMFEDFVGKERYVDPYGDVRRVICREYGVFYLCKEHMSTYEDLINFFLNADCEESLDVIELIAAYLKVNYGISSSSFIDELNDRFKMHGVGYEFVDAQIIRIDNELIHQEVIKPALGFLRDKNFSGANDEFLKAHEFYRHKHYKEALTGCAKSFESVLKGICEKRGWVYNANAAAKDLIKNCLDNSLIPAYMQEHLTQLRVLLETTLTPRNKESAHGQGVEIKSVPEELARYAINLTASNILFLMDCEKRLN